MKKIFFIIIIELIMLNSSINKTFAQSKIEELKKEKEKIEREIRENEKILKEISINKDKNENYINVLNENIKIREKKIAIIENEINYISDEIENMKKQIEYKNNEINELVNKYLKAIRIIKKKNIDNNFLIYIIASKNVNEAYKRLLLLKKINEKVRNLRNEIGDEIRIYKEIKEGLEMNKSKKVKLINELEKEKKNNIEKKEEILKIIKELKQKEIEIRKNIEKRKREYDKINKEIEKLILNELKKREKEGAIIKTNFELDKGKIEWPVNYGIIVGKYGLQKHKILKNVTINNYGIDISVQENSDALAIYNGEVKKIFLVTGYNTGVIINHGEYYSVYMNLIDVYVKEGQKVKENQRIGKIFTDKEKNETILHFQLWKNLENLNPEEWLKKKN